MREVYVHHCDEEMVDLVEISGVMENISPSCKDTLERRVAENPMTVVSVQDLEITHRPESNSIPQKRHRLPNHIHAKVLAVHGDHTL
ncbi:hypothetical protein TNCV_649001 [Trichonephila clavipes]|nr:hypothetical protein TNCV_649001 [Trichonephila clavipes]